MDTRFWNRGQSYLNGQNPISEQTAQPSVEKTPKAGSDYVPMTVETFDNHIYFYASVNTDRCLDLIKRIRQLDNELRQQAASRMLPKDFPNIPIWLHIQSFGGDLFTGLNIADQIASIQTPIYSVVEGVCASSATLVSMACTRRYIQRSSFMLIHQLWSFFWGTYEEFKDETHLLDMLMDRLYNFYTKRSQITKSQLKQLLKHDTWFSAQECIDRGIADEILTLS